MSIRRGLSVLGLVTGAALVAHCAAVTDLGFVADAGGGPEPDADTEAGDQDVVPPNFGDSGSPDAAPNTSFFILVTQTPGGSPVQADWGGVLRYNIASDNAPAKQVTAIDKTLVHDPLGLAFCNKSAEVFVGNRWGNAPPSGGGSISRFLYDASNQTFKPNGDITGNGLGAVGQVVFSPTEDELYAANVTQGSGGSISEFKVDAKGNVTPDTVLTITSSTTIGLAVAPDGKRLYVSSGSPWGGGNVIRQFALPSGTEVTPSVTVPSADRLHLMMRTGSDLYVSDPRSGQGATAVYHFQIASNDDLTLVDTILATDPISVTLSPDGQEMFAVAHQVGDGGSIDRFMATADGGWGFTSKIVPPGSLGGTLTFLVTATPTIPH
jgi:hypothetical protein